MREAVYRPELRQDSTEVSTMAFMIWPACGMPMELRAETYEPSLRIAGSSQRSSDTTIRIEPR